MRPFTGGSLLVSLQVVGSFLGVKNATPTLECAVIFVPFNKVRPAQRWSKEAVTGGAGLRERHVWLSLDG